jgi:hypothetical protein
MQSNVNFLLNFKLFFLSIFFSSFSHLRRLFCYYIFRRVHKAKICQVSIDRLQFRIIQQKREEIKKYHNIKKAFRTKQKFK